MKVRICSDLHCEFWDFNKFERLLNMRLPELPTDKESVLVIAGDSGTFKHYPSTLKPLFNLVAQRFNKVIVVYGNHEWYHTDIWGEEKKFWEDKKLPENVHILQNDYLIIDDVVFIGATLWTSFNDRDFLAMSHGRDSMNDYQCIRLSYDHDATGPYSSPYSKRITPEMTVDVHEKSKAYILKAVGLDVFESLKKVVVTHHMPSEQSVPARFSGDLLNYAFFTELGNEIAHKGPDIWVHGHTHDSKDYMIGETRIICNPFGYHAQCENKEYNPTLILEL